MIGKICGTGSYVPEHFLDNNDLAKIVETSDEWIRERTGVVRRHVVEKDTTVSMAAEASKRALDNAGISAEEVDLIIVATFTSEILLPSTACEVQKKLGAMNATGFDMNAACTGFLFAYNTAQAYIATGMYRTVLIVGAESISNMMNWEDRGTCILFGDGAGAAVLQAAEGVLHKPITYSDGIKGEALTCSSRHRKGYNPAEKDLESFIQMDGQAVFKFAVKRVPEVIEAVLEQAEKQADEIDLFLLHQANKRIVNAVAKRLNQDIEKFPMNIEEYGNTSSASIPLLLDEINRQGRLKRGQKIVMAGFGAGLSWGAVYLEW